MLLNPLMQYEYDEDTPEKMGLSVMKKFLLVLFFGLASVLIFPPPSYARCEDVSELSIADASSDEPYSTATSFTLNAVIADCANEPAGVGTGSLRVVVMDEAEEDFIQVINPVRTNSQGEVLDIDGSPISLVIGQTGTWYIKILRGPTGVLGGDNSLQITIGNEVDTIACGEPAVGEDDDRCEDGCSPYPVYEGGYLCLTPEQIEEERNRTSTCLDYEDISDEAGICDPDKESTEALSCGANGYSCGNRNFTVCFDGEREEGNLRCGSPLSDDAFITCTVCSNRADFPHFNLANGKCCKLYGCAVPQGKNASEYITSATVVTCNQNQVCVQGRGCDPRYPLPGEPPCPADAIDPDTGLCTQVMVGDQRSPILLFTNPTGFIQTLLGFLLSISGMVAIYLILRSGYQIMTSRGNPEAIQEARERLTSAIVGLLFIIFSLVIIQIIGVDILQIPGFGG